MKTDKSTTSALTDRKRVTLERIRENNLDGLLITNPYNIFYLTGFIGLAPQTREAYLLVSQKLHLFTYPTYSSNNRQSDSIEFHNINYKHSLSDLLQHIITGENIKKIGYEKNNLTVEELEHLQALSNTKLIASQNIIEQQRICKNHEEIEKIKTAAMITDQAFEFIKKEIRVGVSEKFLACKLEYFLKEKAGDISFTPIVAFNQNSAIPHHISGKDNAVSKSSLILLDFGAKFENYCADMTRVIFFKTAPDKIVRLYQTVVQSQQLALKNLRAGQKSDYTDRLVRDFIAGNNYPPYPHGLGHGVGLQIHENPRLRLNTDFELTENMVVTIEPGIYLEGEYGVRIEDLVLLKKEGVEILSNSSKEITII